MARIYISSVGSKRFEMIALFKHKWNRRIVRVATTYFLLSTFLMCIILIPETEIIAFVGLILFLCYILITCIALVILLVNVFKYSKDLHEHGMAFTLLILNFPMSLLYLYFRTA